MKSMAELIANLHMHTTYSDGTGTHQEIAEAALQSGLDVVITTDHNVYIQGLDGYRQQGARSVLLLVAKCPLSGQNRRT
jgi:predicted metal-dependent phosphoesterase TrpH